MWQSGDITPKSVGNLLDRMSAAPRSNLAVALALTRSEMRDAGDPRIMVERAAGGVELTPRELALVRKLAQEYGKRPELIHAARAEVRVAGLNPVMKALTDAGIKNSGQAARILSRVTQEMHVPSSPLMG